MTSTLSTTAIVTSIACTALLSGCGGSSPQAQTGSGSHFSYEVWSRLLRSQECGSLSGETKSFPIAAQDGTESAIDCRREGQQKIYQFPAGVFEISEQMLVPEDTSIVGAKDPNDMANPTVTPNWAEQTLFLATWGVTDYKMNYCHADNMVKTRVGFVLSSYTAVKNIAYQGVDTIRPNDNGALCGGAVFETKGCAENDCKASDVNNGGSDGRGSQHVRIENVRLNDYYFKEDKHMIGAHVDGNYECETEDWLNQCCFCKPNGVRSSQQGVWVPQSRNKEGTRDIIVRNLVSMSAQADAINLHGNVWDAVVENVHFENTGDDMYVLWGADQDPSNVTFKDCVAVNSGILRPNWYGNCVATYGLKDVTFQNITCKSPTLDKPIIAPDSTKSQRMATTMFVFYTSFGGTYAKNNRINIKGWNFEDLDGNPYTAESGTMGTHVPGGKMVWTKADNGVAAPYYMVPPKTQEVNVHAEETTGVLSEWLSFFSLSV